MHSINDQKSLEITRLKDIHDIILMKIQTNPISRRVWVIIKLIALQPVFPFTVITFYSCCRSTQRFLSLNQTIRIYIFIVYFVKPRDQLAGGFNLSQALIGGNMIVTQRSFRAWNLWALIGLLNLKTVQLQSKWVLLFCSKAQP